VNVAVVFGDEGFAKVAEPGPLTWLQVEASGLGGVGLVSVTTPFRVAAAGNTIT
jgi:hypothetical protein